MFLSTGSASEKEVFENYEVFKKNGCKDLTILKCTSVYPANFEDLNLMGIPYLKKLNVEDFLITQKELSALTDIALGAEVIEKHVKLNKNDKSLDSFSITVKEFKD